MNFRLVFATTSWYIIVIYNLILLTSAYTPPECLRVCLKKGRFDVPEDCQELGCYCDIEISLAFQKVLKKCLVNTCVGNMSITEEIPECNTSEKLSLPVVPGQLTNKFDPMTAFLGDLPGESSTAPTGTREETVESTSFPAVATTPGRPSTTATDDTVETSDASTPPNEEVATPGLSSEMKMGLSIGVPLGFLVIAVNAAGIFIVLRKRRRLARSLEEGDPGYDEKYELPDNQITGQSGRSRGFCEIQVPPGRIGGVRYQYDPENRSKSLHEPPAVNYSRWTARSNASRGTTQSTPKSTLVASRSSQKSNYSEKTQSSDVSSRSYYSESLRHSAGSHTSDRTYLSEGSQYSTTENENEGNVSDNVKKHGSFERQDSSVLPVDLHNCYKDRPHQGTRSLNSSRSHSSVNTIHTIRIHQNHRSHGSGQPNEGIGIARSHDSVGHGEGEYTEERGTR